MALNLSVPDKPGDDLQRLLDEFEAASKNALPSDPTWQNEPIDAAFSPQRPSAEAVQRQADLDAREAEIATRERRAAEMELHTRSANDLARAEAAVRNVSTEPPQMPKFDGAKLVHMSDADYARWKRDYVAAQRVR